jgi:excinuclease ABC subunit B
MQRAIDETDRRRNIQEKFNQLNNIVPEGITKEVPDVLEGARSTKGRGKISREKNIITENLNFKVIEELNNATKLKKEIRALELRMHKKAKDLDFEVAVRLRDRILELKEILFKT